MDFQTFLKIQLERNDKIGDLVKDIFDDVKFPVNQSFENQAEYLYNAISKYSNHEANEALKKILKLYGESKNQTIEVFSNEHINSIKPLASERGQYIVDSLNIDKVYLIGEIDDYYRIYFVDSHLKKGFKVEIKSSFDLNEIKLINEEKIHVGHVTKITSPIDALNLLENCDYPATSQPNKLALDFTIKILNKVLNY